MVGLVTKEKGNPAPIVPGFKIKGDTIAGRYRVEKLLGAGSSGFVVSARHVYLRRRVTLKILTSTTKAHGQAQRRHLALAHRAAALRGLHIARIVDTGFTEDGHPFIATERLEGRTLADELTLRTHVPAAAAVRWILQACEGLAEAHSAGIIHGDLKPQNLFLAGDPSASTTDGHTSDSRVLKILDFGMATPMEEDEDEGQGGAWFASPAYLAPEQIRDPRAIDARVDIWALGVILHQLISGNLPFSSDTVSGMLVAVAYDAPALLAAEDVPFELARVVQGCLAKEPAARPADVVMLARALAPFAGAEGLGLARRVEAALSMPPPLAVALDADAEPAGAPEAATSEPAAPPRAVDAPASTAAPPASVIVPADDGVSAEVVAFDRRRFGAIAMVGAAAVLAVAGLLAPSGPAAAEGKSGHQPAAETPPPPSRPVEGSALPFIPPSFVHSDEAEPKPETPPPPAPPSPPVPPSQRAEPTTTTAPAHSVPVTAARAIAKDPTPRKPRSSLAVRENPYTTGFTHPTRLPDRRAK